MRRRTIASVLAAALVVWSFATVPSGQACPKRVLFIGNSYTYFNNLPDILRGLAAVTSVGEVDVRLVASGGWRLKEHWEKGDARRLLREHPWDHVVLQDQSTLGVNHYVEGVPHVSTDEAFRPYAKLWAEEIRRTGAVPVFYVTWARKATPEDQAALNYAYITAARAFHGLVAPVGEAWKSTREHHPSLELFQNDGSHPSSAGSYLAACTLFAALFDGSPIGLPARVIGSQVNLDTERVETDK